MNRSPLKIAVAAACTAALMLPLAGCGKDDKPKAGAGSTLDPAVAKYIADAEKICAAAQADVGAITAKYPATPSPKQFEEGVQKGSDRILAEVEELRSVTPPPAIAAKVDAWLSAFAKDATNAKAVTIEQAKKGVDAFAASDPLAIDLGLARCTPSGS